MSFEDWAIEGVLAEGGTATEHAARGKGGDVVIKVLKRALADDPAWLVRFDREQRVLRDVQHPNVVPILESGRTPDALPYIVMPRIRGSSLRQTIEKGPMPAPDAWRIVRAIAGALQAAHEHGIVHRDVKPDNVLLAEGRPKLADFGLAKDIEGDPIKVTETGAPVGTPAYMAPEQWWGHGVGPAVDQYALGILFFELVAGHTPFALADGYAAIMQAHLTERAPDFPDERGRAFVARLLAKKPEERFAAMNDAIAAGDAAFGIAPERAESPRAAWPFAAFAPVLLVLLGYGGLHDPRDWLRIAGVGGWPVAIGWLIAAMILWHRPSLLALALVPGALGTFLTYTGWMATLGGVEHAEIAQRLSIYEEGVFESNVGRFVGGILSAGLLLSALPGTRGRAKPHEVASLAVRLVAFALLATSGLAWIEGQTAHAFDLPTRAERAAAIVRWDHAKTWTSLAIALSVVAILVHGIVRVRRAPRATTLITRPALVLATCWAALGTLDAGFLSRIRETRHALWVQLAPEFELDAKLVPPPMAGLPDPPALPTIAISTERISVDAEPVGLVDAVGTPTGQRVLAADLSHAVATITERHVLVTVDATVPWHVVRSVLTVARDLGVKEVMFLFQRGPTPVLGPKDPPEAAYVLPRDFGGLAVELEGGDAIPDAMPFGEAAPLLRKNGRLAL